MTPHITIHMEHVLGLDGSALKGTIAIQVLVIISWMKQALLEIKAFFITNQ